MGCFSYKCLECGRGILSSSFSGEPVHLYLLEKGKIVEQMTGEYDSYGSVFIDGTQHEGVTHALRKSVEWKTKFPCNYGLDAGDGIAAIHVSCYKKDPTQRSANDPNQGWGDDDEQISYFGRTPGEGYKYPERKPVAGYNADNDVKCEVLRQKIWDLHCSIESKVRLAKICEFIENEDPAEDNRKRAAIKNTLLTGVGDMESKLAAAKKEYESLGGEPLSWLEEKTTKESK